MNSPFPGMDPCLERHWRDVHASLVLYARDQLQPQLGGALRARVEERVVLDAPGEEDDGSHVYPGVRIVSRGRQDRPVSPHATGVVAAEPLVIERLDETHTEGFVQVIDPFDGHRIVTVIEFLSPTNKRAGDDRLEYLRKQRQLSEAGVSLVEIDLLRSGRRIFPFKETDVPMSHRTAYAACVRRGYDPQRFEYYAFPLRTSLPGVRVPLRERDPDAVLDLQALVAQAYANGAYDDLNYAMEPEPPLSGEDAEWAAQLLRTAGLR